MKTYDFTADFDEEHIRLIYSGAARNIMVTTTEGLRIELPAMRFRSFVTRDGLHGSFRLVTDDSNRFIDLERLGGDSGYVV